MNIKTPLVGLGKLDPHSLAPSEQEKDTIFCNIANVAACTVADHARAFGFRGYHMAAMFTLAGLAQSVTKGVSLTVVDEWLAAERSQWPELMDDEGYEVASAFVTLLDPTVDGAYVAKGKAKEFRSVGTLIVAYAEAVRLLTQAFVRNPNLSEAEAYFFIVPAIQGIQPIPENVAFIERFVRGAVRACRGKTAYSLKKAWGDSRMHKTLPQHKVVVGKPAPPAEVKERRLNGGDAAKGKHYCAKARLRLFEPAVALAEAGVNDPNRKRLSDAGLVGFIKEMAGESPRGEGVHNGYFTTFMSPDAYLSFIGSGTWKDVWATGPTWHKSYSDSPLLVRSYQEMRLFGERGDGMTYGYFSTNEQWLDEIASVATRSYGKVEVNWKPEAVAKFATLSPGDMLTAPYVIDAMDAAGVLGLCSACLITKPFAQPYAQALAPLQAEQDRHFNFIEFQCHAPLTPDDIESVKEH